MAFIELFKRAYGEWREPEARRAAALLFWQAIVLGTTLTTIVAAAAGAWLFFFPPSESVLDTSAPAVSGFNKKELLDTAKKIEERAARYQELTR